jgi:hypothetical protein
MGNGSIVHLLPRAPIVAIAYSASLILMKGRDALPSVPDASKVEFVLFSPAGCGTNESIRKRIFVSLSPERRVMNETARPDISLRRSRWRLEWRAYRRTHRNHRPYMPHFYRQSLAFWKENDHVE